MLLKREQYIYSVAKNTVVYYLVNHGSMGPCPYIGISKTIPLNFFPGSFL